MDNILYKSLLFDFYNKLLTNKQRNVYELYNHQDMSLSEIGRLEDVTPQGVSDMLKRTDKILNNYEDNLKLVDNYLNNIKIVKEIDKILDSIKDNDTEVSSIKEKINNLRS